MIDLVTVVFDEEISVLEAQAHSIDLYCDPDVFMNVWIIVNDSNNINQKIDPAWWSGRNVNIVNRSSFDADWIDNGWVSQQALKILGSALCQSPWAMVLDSKTIFVKEIGADIFNESRVRSGSLPIYEVFYPSRNIVNELFDIELDFQIGPGGVPFVFSVDIVKSMIAAIEQSRDCNFADWFQAQGMLTEFILYSGYAAFTNQINDHYDLQDSYINPVNICHSEVGIWDSKITAMTETDPHTVSVHRHAWQQASCQQQQQFIQFLQSKKLTL